MNVISEPMSLSSVWYLQNLLNTYPKHQTKTRKKTLNGRKFSRQEESLKYLHNYIAKGNIA